ncbi:hypothetical protein ACFLQ0_01295 [Nitrospinota bacterium]
MRDVFTIPTSSRQKPHLIGSVCEECEEYFFPKTGKKATCDNPFCPRSTSTTMLSGRGKLLSATVMRSTVDGEEERVSAVIFLEEGIKINSPLIEWEGFQHLLVPGTPVELVLHEMGPNEEGDMVIGYSFRLVTGRKKPQPLESKEKEPGLKTKDENGAKTKANAAGKKQKIATMAVKNAAQKKAQKKKTGKKEAVKKNAAKKKVIKKKAKKRPAVKNAAQTKAQKKKTGKKEAVKKKAAKKKISKKKASSNKSARKKAPSGRKSIKR